MSIYPVDLETGDGEVLVVLSDGSREPLSAWMRRKLDGRSDPSLVERMGARMW